MATYNGHRSWNAWNVSLWINNDEGLYRLAQNCVRGTKTLGAAARLMLKDLQGCRTPDRAQYNLTCIREALRGIES